MELEKQDIIQNLKTLYEDLTDGIETDRAIRVQRYKPILEAIEFIKAERN